MRHAMPCHVYGMKTHRQCPYGPVWLIIDTCSPIHVVVEFPKFPSRSVCGMERMNPIQPTPHIQLNK